MKTLRTYFLLLLAGALLSPACINSMASEDVSVRPNVTLTDEEIDQKLAGFYSSEALDATPNDSVLFRFRTQFPNSYDIDWEFSNGVYEADFKVAETGCKGWYDTSGRLLMYEKDIAQHKLPEAVTKAVKQKYPKFHIDDADKIHKGSLIMYELSIEKGTLELKAFFKGDGTFIREEMD